LGLVCNALVPGVALASRNEVLDANIGGVDQMLG
jgi:hypothetical protein